MLSALALTSGLFQSMKGRQVAITSWARTSVRVLGETQKLRKAPRKLWARLMSCRVGDWVVWNFFRKARILAKGSRLSTRNRWTISSIVGFEN